MADFDTSPRKQMAAGGSMPSGEGFGCNSLASTTQQIGRGNERGKPHLSDDARAAGKPVHHSAGKMPSQAKPDHGSHKYP